MEDMTYKDFQKQIRGMGGLWRDVDHVFFDKDADTFMAFYQEDPTQPAEFEIRYNPVTQRVKLLNDGTEEDILPIDVKDRVEEKVLQPFFTKLHHAMRNIGTPFESDEDDPDYIRYELDTDYGNTYIPKEIICAIIDSVDAKDGRTAKDIFDEYLMDIAMDDGMSYYDDVIGTILESFFSKQNYTSEKEMHKDQRIYEHYKSLINDDILDHINFFYDPQEFYQNIRINMMLDIGNRNFCNNCDYLLSDTNSPERLEHSSLLYLAELQGEREDLMHQIEDFKKWDREHPHGNFDEYDDLLYSQNKSQFIRSALRELLETPDYPVTTTILASIPLDKLIDILSDKKSFESGYLKEEPYLTISSAPDVMVGLYDPQDGAGGSFEIMLDKSIKIPLHCIDFEADNISKKYSQYSVEEVYGMSRHVWTDCVVYNSPEK